MLKETVVKQGRLHNSDGLVCISIHIYVCVCVLLYTICVMHAKKIYKGNLILCYLEATKL